jgi:hypothetical protein
MAVPDTRAADFKHFKDFIDTLKQENSQEYEQLVDLLKG